MPQNTSLVLIVEDEPSVSRALADKFKYKGYDVATASNGQEGLQLAEELQPDIILLDIKMPVMNGIEMLKALRQESWGIEMPVMILTNASDEKRIMEALSQKTYDYLLKCDWEIDDVVKRVAERIAQKSS